MSESVRQDGIGWVWVALGAVATLALPVWTLLTAVIIQLSPDLTEVGAPAGAPGAPDGPSAWAILVEGGLAALQTLAWAALPAGALLVAAVATSVVLGRRAREERVQRDATVATDAVYASGAVDVLAKPMSAPAPTDEEAVAPVPAPAPAGTVAAPPWHRVGAALIDFGLYEITLLPLQVTAYQLAVRTSGPMQDPGDVVAFTEEAVAAGGDLWLGLFLTAMLQLVLGIVQLVLLVNGRTVGKWRMGLRIAGLYDTHAGFERTVLVRTLLYGLIRGFLPVVGWLVMPLVNVALLFGEERRTLADLLAGTTVIREPSTGTSN